MEAEFVRRFGQAGAEGVEMAAQRLHRVRVTRGAQLIQMHLDQVACDADVAAGGQQRSDDAPAFHRAVAETHAQHLVKPRFDFVGRQLDRISEQLAFVTQLHFVAVVRLAKRDLLGR